MSPTSYQTALPCDIYTAHLFGVSIVYQYINHLSRVLLCNLLSFCLLNKETALSQVFFCKSAVSINIYLPLFTTRLYHLRSSLADIMICSLSFFWICKIFFKVSLSKSRGIRFSGSLLSYLWPNKKSRLLKFNLLVC